MKRFIEGLDRTQSTLFPDRLEDWVGKTIRSVLLTSLLMNWIWAAWGSAVLIRRRPNAVIPY